MVVAEVSGVEYSYSTPGEHVHALRGVDLTLVAGQVVALLGSSGSGKSTLLNLLAGLDVASCGEVTVLGTALSRLSERERTEFRLHTIGLVFQEHNLIPQLTAAENVEILLRAQGLVAPRARTIEALDAVGLADQAHRRPPEMSGGQRQRVGVARAIAGRRPLVLCDEPTGSLDSQNSAALFGILRTMAQERGITVLVATHDRDALMFAHSAVTMSDGVIRQPAAVS